MLPSVAVLKFIAAVPACTFRELIHLLYNYVGVIIKYTHIFQTHLLQSSFKNNFAKFFSKYFYTQIRKTSLPFGEILQKCTLIINVCVSLEVLHTFLIKFSYYDSWEFTMIDI